MSHSAQPPLVHSDPAVLGGTPVFVGTRLPIVTLLECLDAGDQWERLVSNWPFLTPEHVVAAREWAASHGDIGVRNWLNLPNPPK